MQINFPDFKLKLNLFLTEKRSYQILFLVIFGLHLIVKFGSINLLELQGDYPVVSFMLNNHF